MFNLFRRDRIILVCNSKTGSHIIYRGYAYKKDGTVIIKAKYPISGEVELDPKIHSISYLPDCENDVWTRL